MRVVKEKEFEERLRKKIDERYSNVSREEKSKYLKNYCKDQNKCGSCAILQKKDEKCDIEECDRYSKCYEDCEKCYLYNIVNCVFDQFTDEELDEFYTFVKTIKKEFFEKSYDEKQKIHKNYIETHTKNEILSVAIEEMAELTKHLTKIMRGKEPMKANYGCIEEMADVQICLDTLKEYMEISDSVIAAAVEVKLERYVKKRNDTNENA